LASSSGATPGGSGSSRELPAAFLPDPPAARSAADDAQRDALARLKFEKVLLKEDWGVAVVPQPSFQAYVEWDCHDVYLANPTAGRFCVFPSYRATGIAPQSRVDRPPDRHGCLPRAGSHPA
jgi:hypothetical protein